MLMMEPLLDSIDMDQGGEEGIDFVVETPLTLEAQWKHLTEMPSPRLLSLRSPRKNQVPTQDLSTLQLPQGVPETPENTPPQSPAVMSPSGRKADHSAQFRYEFQLLIQNNKNAKRRWVQFHKKYKSFCTNKRCIKLLLSFCSHYGHEFEDLCKSNSFRKLGSRSNCQCSISSPIAPVPSPSPSPPLVSLSPNPTLPAINTVMHTTAQRPFSLYPPRDLHAPSPYIQQLSSFPNPFGHSQSFSFLPDVAPTYSAPPITTRPRAATFPTYIPLPPYNFPHPHA